jgi:phosphopantetheine adenylyltransferase
MAGINNLKEVYEKKGEAFLSNLLNRYVIINEKVDGTLFGVKKNKDDQFKYFKKSGEISYVDRVLMKYYNPAISYFESLPNEKRQRIPSNFYFGFEYFTRGDFDGKRHTKMPKNGLVLSYIHKLDDSGQVVTTVQNKEQLDRWADYLGVERPPIIFEGTLNDEQKTAILEFVYSPNEELSKKFKTHSFTKYILAILSGEEQRSDELNVDTIIFRFYDQSGETAEEQLFLAKLVDPMFQYSEADSAKPRENLSQDYIWLIIIDLMNHFELYNIDELEKMAEQGSNYDEKYVAMINQIFKDFIKEYAGKYEGLELEIPEYLKRPEFELDTKLIQDSEVLRLIKDNATYTDIYKILLNFLRRNRKKSSSGFFTPELLTQLNIIVDKIRNVIMGNRVYEGLFPSFSEFVGAPTDEGMLSEKEIAEGKAKREEPVEVNLLIGNFQPVSMGHIKAAQKLKAKNDCPIVLVAVKPEKPTAKLPFSSRITKLMLEKIKQEYSDLIVDIKMIESGQIEEILEQLHPKYKPLLWGTSERRVKDYALQLEYIKKKKIPLRLAKDFKLVELPSFVKSEDVIKTIKDSDFAEFKKAVPTCIASEFFNLQKELERKTNEGEEKKSKFGAIFESKEISAEVVDPKLKEEDLSKDSL